MKNIIFFLFLFVFSLQVKAQSVFKINTPVGFKFSAKAIMQNDMELSFGGESKKVESKATYYYHIEVKNITAENIIEYGITIDTLIIEATEGKEKHYAHSNHPKTYKDDKKLSKAMESLGKEAFFKVTQSGKIVKEEETPQIAEFCFIEFSEKAISEKESWTAVQIDESMGFENKTENTYTLEKIGESEIIVSGKSLNKLIGEEPVSSSYIIDPKTGLLKSYDFIVESNMMGKMVTRVIYNASW